MLSTMKKLINRLINSTNSTENKREDQRWSRTSSIGRRNLLWLPLANDIQNEEVTIPSNRKEPIHHIRHHGKHHKPNTTTKVWHNHYHPQTEMTTSINNMLDTNPTSNPSSTTINTLFFNNSLEDDNVRQTAICYTTNEVLLIIGLTCILNFAFIVLIMTCVHFCSSASTSKVADLPRLESLVLGDSELGSKRTSSSGGVEILSGVQDYVDSLPLLFRPTSGSMVSLQNLRSPLCSSGSLLPFMQETSCQPDTQIPPSLSMENLLFTN